MKVRIGSIVRVRQSIAAPGKPFLATDVDCLVTSGGGPRIKGRFAIQRLSDKACSDITWWVDADSLIIHGWVDPTVAL